MEGRVHGALVNSGDLCRSLTAPRTISPAEVVCPALKTASNAYKPGTWIVHNMPTNTYKTSDYTSGICSGRQMLRIQASHPETSQQQVDEEHNAFDSSTPTSYKILQVVIEKTHNMLRSEANTYLVTLPFRQGDESTERRSEAYLERQHPWHMQIKCATKIEDAINAIRIGGFDSIAERLTLLHKIIEEEQDEKPIVLHSLQNFALFMVFESQLPNPRVGINPNGLLQAVWRIPNYGTLAMNFLPSGDVMFSIVFRQQELPSPQRKISGVMPRHKMMYHIREFVDKLTA